MNLFIVITIIWVVSEILLARMMRDRESKNTYDKSSLKIIWITIALAIPLGIILRRPDFVLSINNAYFIYYSGILLICGGLAIRWFAIFKLKKAFTVNVSISKDQKIVRSGIYKYIRHPSYSGSLLSFLGLGLVFNNWLTIAIIFIPVCASFLYRISIEEKVLSEAFGNDYTDYMKRSWKLLPWVY